MTDPVVEQVRAKLLERSRVGVTKYNTTLAGSTETRLAFLNHAQQEALDLANYLQVLINREQQRVPL